MRFEFAIHLPKVEELCRRFGVLHLDAFGSSVEGRFDSEESDVDLYAVFSDTREPGYADRYLDFAESLEVVFRRKVDLLTPGAVRNPRFAESIKKNSVTLYDAEDHQTA